MPLKDMNVRLPKAGETKSMISDDEDSDIVWVDEDSDDAEAMSKSDSNERTPSEDAAECDSDDEEPLTEEMLVRVCDTYWSVRAEYEGMVDDEAEQEFEQARMTPVKYEIRGGDKPKPLDLNPLPVDRGQPYAALKDWRDKTIDRAPIFMLPKVKALPPMQYWTLSEVNVKAGDELSLSHIPYFEEEQTAEEEKEFWEDIQDVFPDGIHGTEPGLNEYINDWILYFMVKNVLVESALDASNYKDLHWVMRHVHALFPNKGSVDNLIAAYPDLQERFEPETVKKVEMANDRGELVANFAPEKLLGTCSNLLCHACFSYDCRRHSALTFTMNNRAGARKDSNKKDKAQGPCGDDCYLTMAETDLSAISSGPSLAGTFGTTPALMVEPSKESGTNLMPSPSAQQSHDWNPADLNAPSNVPGWTPHEESVYWLIEKSACGDFCHIAEILETVTPEGSEPKTCREVYEYAQLTAHLKPAHEDNVQTPQRQPAKKKKDRRAAKQRFRAAKWLNNGGEGVNKARYIACQHDGHCSRENGCRCVDVGNSCTKYCGCPLDCPHRFPGCGCGPGQCRSKACECFFGNVECDPDVCKSCNCDKSDADGVPICRNTNVQRGLQKKLIIAPSQLAGWGAFANEDIKNGDFIIEYTGEVISDAEAERRGRIYDRKGCSYLFTLNNEQSVDATRIGNLSRFINHDSKPNCKPRVLVVNGEHKIGIFAARNIKRGEELFFDYNYDNDKQAQLVPKEVARLRRKQEQLKKATKKARDAGKPSTSRRW
ncbi:SET domain-containing protein [Aphelenchoides avenae]|nr:SET domain-containing protein [Aphelenchus avenae]